MAVDDDVHAFLDRVEHPVRRRDAETMLELMGRITGQPARMWGPSIVGFGSYHYRYESGREGDAPAAGFSPRKAATTVYLADGVDVREVLEVEASDARRVRADAPEQVGVGAHAVGEVHGGGGLAR